MPLPLYRHAFSEVLGSGVIGTHQSNAVQIGGAGHEPEAYCGSFVESSKGWGVWDPSEQKMTSDACASRA